MKVSVITVVSGRHAHLAGQLRGLSESSVEPWHHVVVAMGDREIQNVVADTGAVATVVDIEASGSQLPIALARNTGASLAADAGADLMVFLDVDCIPGAELLQLYEASARTHPRSLLCGPVTYLPPKGTAWTTTELRNATRPHAARPDPPTGTVEVGSNYDLFWSLSFAVTPAAWTSIGGFFEGYSGYGGEDTDFAATAKAAGIGLQWIGGAHAYHQYHPVSSPPVEHLDDIVRNSTLFHRRWNRWPMEGWLDEFERRGLITRTAAGIITSAE